MKSIDPPTRSAPAIVHPAWLRLAHWLNTIAVLILLTCTSHFCHEYPHWRLLGRPGV